MGLTWVSGNCPSNTSNCGLHSRSLDLWSNYERGGPSMRRRFAISHISRFSTVTYRVRLVKSSIYCYQNEMQFNSCLMTIGIFEVHLYYKIDLEIQSWHDQIRFMIYSRLSLSRLRLSRITAYLEEKIWSLL